MPDAPSSTPVPNLFPRADPGTTRLAVIGEAPGEDEVVAGEPFVGTSGRYLRAILAQCGASCDQTFFGNICQHNPRNNDITLFDFDGPEIQSGLALLKNDLRTFRPNCTLLLGRTAFRAFRPDLCYPTKGASGCYVPLSDWRGSIFTTGNFGVDNAKCIGTYHPTYILRSYNDAPFFKFDVARAVRHSGSPLYSPQTRQGILRPTLREVLTYIRSAISDKIPQTLDIEGYPDPVGVTMLSFVPTEDPSQGIVIPFQLSGRYWGEEEEWQVWQAVAEILADPLVPKTAHNCFYELFVLAWRHHCIVNNLAHDTMMAHWELYPDFAKGDREEKTKVSATQKKRSLGVCASLYTEQPFYKDDRLSDDQTTKLNYNFLDSSVTAEVKNVATAQLRKVPASYSHYLFNISIVPAYNYIMLRGVRFDREKAASLAASVSAEINDLNRAINQELERRNVFHLFPLAKADEKHRGRDGFNVKSPKQKCWLIYEHLGCKELQRWGRTSDEDALLHYFGKTRDSLLRLVIRCVRKRTRLSDIGKLLPDTDGRLRTSYDLVGTNSGRCSARNSMSMVFDAEEWEWVNTGTNLQNQTEELRVCEIADSPDHSLGQWDLIGADAWTVAAELAALGHPTMLDDLLYGIKPSLVLYQMVEAHAAKQDVSVINRTDRSTLKANGKLIKTYLDSVKGRLDPTTGRPLDWLYLCCKRVQHGSNYDMQAARTAELIFGDSDGAVDISAKDAELYQRFYKLRYKTDVRNDWIRKVLEKTACIVTSGGMRRQFFGIRTRANIDDATVREASAVNPQFNTTYITNTALRNMWYDPENRKSSGALHVEPMIQVHDALIEQHRNRDVEFTARKMRQWFQVPVRVQGIEVKIPVEGKYGPTWGDAKTPFPT